MWRRSYFLLFGLALLFPTPARTDSLPMLTVSGSGTYLYARQDDDSQNTAVLVPGERLVLLAHAVGKSSWYMVKTQQGAIGWVKASAVTSDVSPDKIFDQADSPSTLASLPPDFGPPTTASLRNASTVTIVLNGVSVVVAVVLNRSLRISMIMDTGSSFTTVTPAVAKKLGLKLGSRVTIVTANGKISVPLARLDSIKVGNAEVTGLLVTVQNFAPDSTVNGLLGLNFLSHFHTSIDSRHQALTLAPR